MHWAFKCCTIRLSAADFMVAESCSATAAPPAHSLRPRPWRLLLQAKGDMEKAREAIVKACNSMYGRASGDYMASLAAVHAKRRGWEL